MHSITVPYVQRIHGGPEEVGCYCDAGELCGDPPLVAFGATYASGRKCALRASAEIQVHLDRDWNAGDDAGPLDNVLSAGRFETRVHDGWPPLAFPSERPISA